MCGHDVSEEAHERFPVGNGCPRYERRGMQPGSQVQSCGTRGRRPTVTLELAVELGKYRALLVESVTRHGALAGVAAGVPAIEERQLRVIGEAPSPDCHVEQQG